jgi:hypothetical protein
MDMAELNARIALTDETRTDLKALAGENERYEDVLRRLLREHAKAVQTVQ